MSLLLCHLTEQSCQNQSKKKSPLLWITHTHTHRHTHKMGLKIPSCLRKNGKLMLFAFLYFINTKRVRGNTGGKEVESTESVLVSKLQPLHHRAWGSGPERALCSRRLVWQTTTQLFRIRKPKSQRWQAFLQTTHVCFILFNKMWWSNFYWEIVKSWVVF